MKMFLILKKKTLIVVSIILVLVILLTTLLCVTASSVFGKQKKLPIYSVDTDKKEIAISFDCAWGVDYTNEILDIMQQENIVSTFFMVKFWAEKYPEYVKKIDQMGHEIGSHSSTHPHMTRLDQNTMIREIQDSVNAINKITNKKVEVFRPPFGDYNDLLISVCESMGIYPIQWDVDSLDWKNLSANEISSRVLKRVQNGSIILCHNNGLHTAEALPFIIKELKKRGYTFKRIGDLIYKNNYHIDSNGRQKSYV